MAGEGRVVSMNERGIILFAHGARDPQWAEPFHRIRQLVQQALPEVQTELAYLELMEPHLPEVVDDMEQQGIRHVTLVPLFMAQGGHLKQDLPVLINDLQMRHPHLSIVPTPAIGESPDLLKAIANWVTRQSKTLD
jgi:sirohydrochlorin cobaltochelatase